VDVALDEAEYAEVWLNPNWKLSPLVPEVYDLGSRLAGHRGDNAPTCGFVRSFSMIMVKMTMPRRCLPLRMP
jgi:hypothetical protein